MFRALALFACLASAANAWTTTPTGESSSISRRNVFQTITTSAAAAVVAASSPSLANAMEACPPKSQNCVRATWSPPAGTAKKDSAKAVRDVLNAYPQEGQSGGKVDGGGWTIVQDDLDSNGTARVEYKSRYVQSGKRVFSLCNALW